MKETVGDLIARKRNQKGMTAKELIAALGERLSTSYVGSIEHRGVIPRPELLCKIADILGIDRTTIIEMAKEERLKSYQEALDRSLTYRKNKESILERRKRLLNERFDGYIDELE